MHLSTLLFLTSGLLSSLDLSAAGPHARNGIYLLDRTRIRVVHRRHHARLDARSSSSGCDDDVASANSDFTSPKSGGPGPANLGSFSGTSNSSSSSANSPATPALAAAPLSNLTATAGCTEGAWQCAGSGAMILQVCDHDNWVTLATCSGDNIVCSASGAVGCVWANSNGTAANMGATSATVGNTTVVGNSTLTNSTSSTDPSADGDDSDEDGEDGEDEECDDGEDTEVVYASGSQVITTTLIGQGLLANQTSSPTTNASYPAITTAAVPLPTTLANGTFATVTANVTLLNVSMGLATPTATANLSSILSATTTATGAVVTTTGATVVSAFTAPHWVVYADNWLNTMPSVSSLASYNRFILAFWMSNNGPVDNAQDWTWMSASYRAQVLQEYHAAGIALMVSAFGSTDAPTSWGYDPVQTAQNLAAFVIEYGFDGVDIDYEDMNAMNNNQAEAWIIPFQQELRSLLPAPYLITHAPVAPWFTSANDYASGAYVNIHQTVGWSIDWYNVQYYNQGNGIYTTCETMLFQSNNMWPSTSVFELNSYAQVPLDKIVLGKPMDPNAADNGYVTPAYLNQCVQQGNAQGWNGGVMFWEWSSAAPGVMATVRGQ